jgi:hypothetical protein
VIDPHETDDKLWKDEQLESERSINITIRNDTEFGMTKSKQTLKEGIWSKMPPIYIPPNTVVEFGCRRLSLFCSCISSSRLFCRC